MTPYFEGWWRWVLVFGLGVWLGTALAGCHPPRPVCHPGAQVCLEGDVWTCSGAGRLVLSVDCPGVCEVVEADEFGPSGPACEVSP